MKKYSLLIFLVSYSFLLTSQIPFKMTTIMHLIVVKNRLFFMACYEEYQDFSSINKIHIFLTNMTTCI
mgnify:CR=1 FL=1